MTGQWTVLYQSGGIKKDNFSDQVLVHNTKAKALSARCRTNKLNI